MTGEALKSHFATALDEAGYVVLSIADGKHGPAEGMPDLCILGPWAGQPAKVELEFKSARERLRPAQARYAEAAYRVVGDGYVYRVVRQTPEAPGELAARAAATCLGLVTLAASLPVAGPGAVYAERPALSPIGDAAVDIPIDADPDIRAWLDSMGPTQRASALRQLGARG